MGTVDDLRKRIEVLNRAPLPVSSTAELEALRRRIQNTRTNATPSSALQPLVYRRDMPQPQGRPRLVRVMGGAPMTVQEAIAGQEIAPPQGGKAYLVTHRLRELGGQWERLHDSYLELFVRGGARMAERMARVGVANGLAAEQVIFVDLETTGLGSSPLFLVGTMTWEPDGLVVRQYLARDYAEEPAAISAFLEHAGGRKLMVSFNGKSFDMPYLRTRATANAVPCLIAAPHLDLLHECRRVYKGRLPDCKLQTLERHVCGRVREGDIPGSQIPDAYHEFVRTGDARELAVILEHNRLDLVTLADLMVHLWGIALTPE